MVRERQRQGNLMAVSKYFSNTYISEAVDLSQGELQGASYVDKFGYNSALGNTYETIWSGNNVYTYIASAGTATVTSGDTGDNGGTVLIQGLDAAYNEVSETLTIGGSAGSVQFYRVHRASLETANTGDVNQGAITVTVDSKSAAIIPAGYGQTLMCLYTVPRRKKGYLFQLDVGCSKDLETEIKILVRNGSTNVWNTKSFITTRGGFLEKNFHIPIEIPATNDIEVRAKASATSAVSAGFELVLVDK